MEKTKPIWKNGHRLVTLFLSNVIINEALPVIADPVFGGGFHYVVVSNVLVCRKSQMRILVLQHVTVPVVRFAEVTFGLV